MQEEKKKQDDFKKKKEEIKNIFKDLKKQNDLKIQIQNENKQNQKLEDKMFLENYNNLLEKQNLERNQERNKMLTKIQNVIDNSNNTNNLNLIQKSVKLNDFLERKFIKEKIELDHK